MQVIPAIDLLDGNIVRLRQGKKECVVAYALNPLELLGEFRRCGAKTVHVVDLNSALGSGDNSGLIKKILEAKKMSVQVGGGIRSVEKAFNLLKGGAEKIILGTVALEENALPKFVQLFGKRVWVAVDVQDQKIRVNGWVKKTNVNYLAFLNSLARSGIGGVVLTDVSSDGVLNGINREFYENARSTCNLPLIASGGISSLQDLQLLNDLQYEGAVIGKALYENKIDLREAIELVENVG